MTVIPSLYWPLTARNPTVGSVGPTNTPFSSCPLFLLLLRILLLWTPTPEPKIPIPSLFFLLILLLSPLSPVIFHLRISRSKIEVPIWSLIPTPLLIHDPRGPPLCRCRRDGNLKLLTEEEVVCKLFLSKGVLGKASFGLLALTFLFILDGNWTIVLIWGYQKDFKTKLKLQRFEGLI